MNHENKLLFWFSRLRTSIGYIPSIMTVGAIILALLLTWIDEIFFNEINKSVPWLFGGSPDAARNILSTIAGSLISVISIAFSITIIALQQAANQYSPRVLRNFTSDKGNQLVLGIYIATFTYALLVLRTVRSGEENFVPELSVAVAFLLTLICLGFLIYFIHKMVNSLQAVEIIKRIHEGIRNELKEVYPEKIGKADTDPKEAKELKDKLQQSKKQLTIFAEKAGFVSLINQEIISEIKNNKIKWVYIPVMTGDFVNHTTPLAIIDNLEESEDVRGIIKRAIEIHDVRSINEDPLFGIRQLVDIALRGISPGTNDPTTAEYALKYMGNNLIFLAQRKLPENQRSFEDNPTKFILNAPSWEDFITLSFTQIRREASDEPWVMHVIVSILAAVGQACPTQERKEPILQELKNIEDMTKKSNMIAFDKKQLLDAVSQAGQTVIQ